MSCNYDTRNNQIFPRIERIEIQYPASGIPSITYTERRAVVLDGKTQFLDGAAHPYPLHIEPPKFSDRIPLVNPATGELIEGQTTSLKEVLMGITAVLRNDQVRRDAEAQALADAAVQAAEAARLAAEATQGDAPVDIEPTA
jgi:hypothetical protein